MTQLPVAVRSMVVMVTISLSSRRLETHITRVALKVATVMTLLQLMVAPLVRSMEMMVMIIY